ncbi:ATP-binding protein [Luteolibacter arcticus]|uniref:ATP-binding protein n=1 Tax=Luteolibacter arcticus TaxID=1581411 RepID=A0ABT3GDK5_9BACT|nr:chemotaxis protein CheB [Luteolibacter arcticus]MCW1921704.1 ATP-binding protein [Luteolibacter arcticus]
MTVDPTTPSPAEEPIGRGPGAFPVVGVGASAGGLEALRQLLAALPPDTGMGFVIVQHLAPERESSLAEILSRATKMPVCEVSEACGEPEVEADHVYVSPPGCELIIEGGKLRLLPQERNARHHGIDQFFRALAEDCGHKAIGVVLSGAMSDGTLGLESIKAEGGITFAQDESAEHVSMPRSAVASGCVDFVLPPAEIAREIARIARHPYVAPADRAAIEEEPGHARIAEIVNRAMGVDFTHYKSNTLHRRITRRMVLHKMDSVKDYEDHLMKSPEEIEALYQDILINVTSFFRDPEAFGALSEKVFPKLLEGRSRQDPLRIWTLGCSTGEESYSLAIALAECAEAAGSDVPMQIFATDLNATGIATARAAIYSKSIAQDVPAERLKRFFVEESRCYRICKQIRDRCIFSRHNVLGDPPFSRVDFISCRNVLIYMQPVLQQQIVPLLHYALKPGGFLWLGSSETAGTSRALFEVADARHKIYVRQPGGSPPGTRFRPWHGATANNHFPEDHSGSRVPPRAQLLKEAERVLLTKYAPPGVIISPAMEILQFRGDTGPYLTPAAGAASLNLLKMLREGLLVSVRAAILRATAEGRPVREEGLRVKDGNGFRELAVEVIPIQPGEANAGGFLVLFEEGQTPATEVGHEANSQRDSATGHEEISRLSQELIATREYLQAVIEQQETVNEELQSANEEAQSANEEMQSVNEELETSKEEIQSSNEELATVNDELNNRNVELNELNDSLALARDYSESIVASMRSPLVVLDAGLRVKTASVAFYETFRVTHEKTEGRLIYDLGNGQWNIAALRVLLEELLPQMEVIDDFEVRHTFEQIGPRIMLLNARRLVQGSGKNQLIVLAIEDITGRRAHEDELAAHASELVRADRSKDEFLAMLAHELRNPLAPLRNAAEILQTPGAPAAACEHAQGILARQVGNMTRMIDDLLDISRITEGKIELRKEVVSLEAVFSAAASLANPAIEAHGQQLTITLPTEPVFLNGDATRLDQVFGNLLGNACKYSGSGCQIWLTAELVPGQGNESPQVIVRVRDNGIGIAPALLPHIFDLFVQATRASDRAYGGLGIGLTVVQRLVTLHGGSVEVHSDGLGHGSEFVVRLPILPGRSAPPPPCAAPAVERSFRMLIVDDNVDAAETMALLQELRGHQTRFAHSGPAALALAAEFLPEVVLLDIGLPGMDGYEVARALRAIPELDGAFLVAMTGYGSDEHRARAKEAGFDEHLVKPADLQLLQEWLWARA